MAKIELRNGQYTTRVSLTAPDGTRTVARVTARTKRELAAAVAARRVQFERDCAAPHERVTTMTVTEAVEAWIRDRDISDATLLSYEGIVRNHVDPDPFGAMPVASVQVRDVEDWVSRLRQDSAPSSIRQMTGLVSAAFARLVRRDELTRNPVAMVGNIPTAPKGPVKALSSEQVNTLLDAAKGQRVEGLVVLGLMLGLRIGEILALRWSDVDMNAALLRIERTMTRAKKPDGGYTWTIGTEPKSAHSARTLNMPLRVQAYLRRQQTAQTERLGYVPEYVVDRGDGLPHLTPKSPTSEFRRLCVDCGLPEWVTPHAMRHSWATHALARGVPITTVSRMLGHSNASITLGVYAHHLRQLQDEATAVLENMYGAEPAPVVGDVRLAREV